MSAGDRDTLALAELLDQHRPMGARCVCGYTVEQPALGTMVPATKGRAMYVSLTASQHRAHVADVLLASDWLREQRTEAWDEGHEWCDGICYGTNDHPNPYRTTEDTDAH